jgi:porphobilinogen synthase
MSFERPRRNRKSAPIRELLAETCLTSSHLIYPVFVCDGQGVQEPIRTLPGQYRWSLDLLTKKIGEWQKLGLKHFALFPKIEESLKDSHGKESLNDHGLLARTIKTLKNDHADIVLYGDVALDPYSSDGHDGIVRKTSRGVEILNDESVEILARMALKQAQWGVDWVAPSDMMDGRIRAIRALLDREGFSHTNILAYSAKYASSFYGPFREALDSAPKSGDKKTYQMDPRNRREALREVRLDVSEGADMVMVKPGLPYLDVISDIKTHVDVPVAAYNVSGEYAMIKFAAEAGALDEKTAMMECLISLRRAGADAILTYFAVDAASIL